MTVVLVRDTSKKTGHTEEWTASADGLANKGIGKTRAEAIDSLVRANVEAFGIEQWTEIDPRSSTVRTDWITSRFGFFRMDDEDETPTPRLATVLPGAGG